MVTLTGFIATTGHTAAAAVLNAAASGGDTRVDASGGSQDVGAFTNFVGELYNFGNGTNTGIASVYVFDLPTIPVGEAIQDANLTLSLTQRGTSNYAVDLYGLQRTSSSTTVTAGDYFEGPADAANSLIVDNLADSTTLAGPLSASGATIASFVAQRYASFGPGHDFEGNDDFIFVRLNRDTTGPSAGYQPPYGFGAVNSQDSAVRPTLSITTAAVPEPTAIGLTAAALAAVSMRRRRPAAM
jgi:hypothetical protein